MLNRSLLSILENLSLDEREEKIKKLIEEDTRLLIKMPLRNQRSKTFGHVLGHYDEHGELLESPCKGTVNLFEFSDTTFNISLNELINCPMVSSNEKDFLFGEWIFHHNLNELVFSIDEADYHSDIVGLMKLSFFHIRLINTNDIEIPHEISCYLQPKIEDIYVIRSMDKKTNPKTSSITKQRNTMLRLIYAMYSEHKERNRGAMTNIEAMTEKYCDRKVSNDTIKKLINEAKELNKKK